MQAPLELAFVAHLDLDPFIETELDEIQGLLHGHRRSLRREADTSV